MTANIAGFFDGLKQKRVGIIGLGVSHNELIELLLSKGIKITLLDCREKEKIAEYESLSIKGVTFDIGSAYLDNLTRYDIIFRTPGVYFLKPELVAAREQGVIITSEIEVFFKLCPCKIYGVTGSDGKTTTTTLIAKMLEKSGKTVHIGGNIGVALLPKIEQIGVSDVCVIELSSFQLISFRASPHVAVVTNITPNHLDVHRDMTEYIDCKKNLVAHQDGFSKTVLSLDNEPCRALTPLIRGSLSYFSLVSSVRNGAFLDENGNLCRAKNGVVTVMFNRDKIRLPGIHNVENYLAAISAVCDEVSDKDILSVAAEFGGVEHRIEFVRELDGVSYYNDSIASSPTRTIAGLNSFKQKMIIIAGGYDKKIPYEPLALVLIKRAKLLILLGATAKSIRSAVENCLHDNQCTPSELTIIDVSTLEEAVAVAKKYAVSGDVVSLSPASASFDLYKNFEERGRHFKKIVNELN